MAEADARRPSAVELPPSAPTDDMLVVYTSGTTGHPKGAVHTHASLLAGVRTLVAAWEWQPDDRLVLALPLFHVHGLCAGLFGTLAAGASAAVLDRFDEEAVVEAAATSTMFFGVPTMYHRLASSGRAAALAGLRLCVSGSAPLAADLWQALHAPGLNVLERYGMTETLLTVSNPLRGERRPGSVGLPLPACRSHSTAPTTTAWGSCSCARRRSVAATGAGRAPLTDADGWFATGDLASVAGDGYVTIRGRRTELIITGGHNVYPAEVESVLARHRFRGRGGRRRRALGGMGRDRRRLRRRARRSPRPPCARPDGRGGAGAVQAPAAGCTSSTRCRATPWARSSRARLREARDESA